MQKRVKLSNVSKFNNYIITNNYIKLKCFESKQSAGWVFFMNFKLMKSNKITSIAHSKKSKIIFGMVLSRTSISFENRDRMRPLGVWSKNVIGACVMPYNKVLWSLIAANMQPTLGSK